MGGINHQPCRTYLAESTRLSRCVSSARSHFEQANIALEDVILLELDGKSGSAGPIKHHLQLSQDHLLSTLSCLGALKAKMEEMGYRDLPELRAVDLSELGNKLVSSGMAGKQSWDKMSGIMSSQTFYGNVREFETQASALLRLTQDLLSAVSDVTDFADDGKLNEVLEENRTGNFKRQFARLYASWNKFMSDFLASSLISTEIWYAHNGFGSLVGKQQVLVPEHVSSSLRTV
jgi:hypothetical protein